MIDASKVRGMLNLIREGVAFKNPYEVVVLDLILNKIEIHDPETGGLVVEAISTDPAVINAFNKIQALLEHTDRLSGVDLVGDGTNLMTVAKTAQAARDIDDKETENLVFACFGTIVHFPENYIKFVEFVTAVAGGGDLTEIANTFATDIDNQVIGDIEAYTKCKILVIQFSVASNLLSCNTDVDLSVVMNLVMTDKLKTEVSKALEASKKKVSLTIYDESLGSYEESKITEIPESENNLEIPESENNLDDQTPSTPSTLSPTPDNSKLYRVNSGGGGAIHELIHSSIELIAISQPTNTNYNYGEFTITDVVNGAEEPWTGWANISAEGNRILFSGTPPSGTAHTLGIIHFILNFNISWTGGSVDIPEEFFIHPMTGIKIVTRPAETITVEPGNDPGYDGTLHVYVELGECTEARTDANGTRMWTIPCP